MPEVLTLQQVLEFRSQCSVFNKQTGIKVLTLLNRFEKLSLSDAKVLVAYHDVLLFFKAYPPSKKILGAIQAELKRVESAVSDIMARGNYSSQRILSGSGIAGSLLIGQYSFAMSKWLVESFPDSVFLESINGDKETGSAILYSLLPDIEYYYTTQGNKSLQKRVLEITGNDKFQMQKIFNLFNDKNNLHKTTDLLYDQLKIYTEWKLVHPDYSRSFTAGLSHPVYYHKNIKKIFVFEKEINKPLPGPSQITIQEKRHLINVARASLAFYYRETDPVTFADENEVKFFHCGRGISIALYGMEKEKRLSIESYIGYMVFKNSVPVAYGGGWIFGERCKIGVNIYPPFRGGESALIFSEVIRTYHQYFNIKRFIVRPYQFGKGNKEGLNSGAFWFYYKLGFRPSDPGIAMLASNEYTLKKKTAIEVLRKFTGSDLELLLKPDIENDFDPALISKAITKMIISRFQGNRTKAIEIVSKSLKKYLGLGKKNNLSENEASHFNQFSLMLSLLPGLKSWSLKDRKKLAQLIKSKSSKGERDYIVKLQKNRKLIDAFYSLLK